MNSSAELLRTLSLVLTVWVWLGLVGGCAPWLGTAQVSAIAFGGAALWLWLAPAPGERRPGMPGLAAAYGAGLLLQPFLAAWIVALGTQIGLPQPDLRAPRVEDPWLWISLGILGPMMEEGLYRRQLLRALLPWLRAPLALVLSSAAFAWPHLEAWPQLGTFGVGLGLGGIWLATRSATLCTAFHAGLNGATLVIPWLVSEGGGG